MYDQGKLIISEGTDPTALIEKGFAALGGIGALVQKGATVVIKPNFSVPRKPEEAATTNPSLVAAVVKQCLAAGAKEVKVIDYPFSSPPVCLTNSGIKEAVESVGGKAYAINAQSFYTQVDTGGKVLKTALFSKDVINADVLINFPILKHHNMTKVTLGMKNMMGLVWDRGYFHRTDLMQCIAELTAFRKPHLTIVDATRGIIDNGPMGPGTIHQWNQVIFGVDPVAVDSYAATLFGVKPAEIDYITAAAQLGVGEMNLQKLTIVKA
ncbi:MAG: hypothetical protein K0R55_1745 [Sporomusa sp.]|nr:hypothetical protein [Sporomusa sp.]